MTTKIEVGRRWIECELSYPLGVLPVLVPGPLGTERWQPSPYSRFNARLTVPFGGPFIPTGRYNVVYEGMSWVFEAIKPEGEIVWGNLSEKA